MLSILIALTLGLQTVPTSAPFTEGPLLDEGETALVRLGCYVEVDGKLGDCVVVSEYPLGRGYGQEALCLSRRSRVNRRDMPVDERPRVEFNMRFRIAVEEQVACTIPPP